MNIDDFLRGEKGSPEPEEHISPEAQASWRAFLTEWTGKMHGLAGEFGVDANTLMVAWEVNRLNNEVASLSNEVSRLSDILRSGLVDPDNDAPWKRDDER